MERRLRLKRAVGKFHFCFADFAVKITAKYIPVAQIYATGISFSPVCRRRLLPSILQKEVNPVLTFEFTGVEGRMTGSEILTSGMVGKTVQILFDDSWTNLTKTLVFRAGQIQATAPGDTFPAVIPGSVLAHPFRKLHVGVYGTDPSGNLVIPTLMAEGPMIRYGADPTELSPAEGDRTWKKLLEQVGDPDLLETDTKESLVAAINELNRRPGGTGMSRESVTLLIKLLRHALYESNQSSTVDALETALTAGSADPGQGETPDSPGASEVTLSHITAVYTGGSVPVGTDIYSLEGLTVTAHYSDGSAATVTGYNLGGQISKAGSNTLSVGYNGQYTTVSVTGYEVEKTLTGITAHYTGGSVAVGTELTALYPDLTVMAQYSDGSTEAAIGYGLSGAVSNVGGNVITVMFGGFTATFTVTGTAVSSGDGNVLARWDFTAGSWADSVGNLEAIHAEDVTMDTSGALLTSTASYIQVPLAPGGSELTENTVEIKFGQMSLSYNNVALRLAMTGNGTQPMSSGLYYKGNWMVSSTVKSELTDVNAFSGKTLVIRHSGVISQFYLDGQLLCEKTPGYAPSYLSIGSSASSAPGVLVESVTIRKEA